MSKVLGLVRSYYSANINDFLSHGNDSILGKLAYHHRHDLEANQKNAWLEQIDVLRDQLKSYADDGHLFFEFSIPRMGKRADVILVVKGVIFILEFKVGASKYHASDLLQSIDYALDLKNFHEGSHDALLVPILVATNAKDEQVNFQLAENEITYCLKANNRNLEQVINKVLSKSASKASLDPIKWANSRYKPTPTIIQAAQALYQGHDVKDISRSDSGAENLTVTAACISGVIEHAKANHEKAICFVTGVPGAGKTLAGLNVANSRMNAHEDEHAVFLSGNGPLVDVLREALARDEQKRLNISKKDALRKACSFIQNIHHFRDDNLGAKHAPIEKVAVFDEAQRAWDRDHVSKFMRHKKGVPDFDQSEPDYLVSVMDRHQDWCVIVCLVGGGQEINNGEAGLSEWFAALNDHYKHWKVYYSDKTLGAEYSWGNLSPSEQVKSLDAIAKPELHLAVSVRSFRAEKLSEFVHAVVHNEPVLANKLYSELEDRYPLYLCRDIHLTREWLYTRARGSELYGLVASSGAIRLKPEGINVKAKAEAVQWFLNGNGDVRACQYLEDVATEFDVQGLELDWTGVCWDADLRYCNGQWTHQKFKGTKWQNVKQEAGQRYLENAYRVLLTRARQGMVIFVPKGCVRDTTRPEEYYNETFEYLRSCGIPEL
ncbi:DUF2075 domain-containing protein [Endozoicomonadaceae bacterium StTr2]